MMHTKLIYNQLGKIDLCAKIGYGWISINFSLLLFYFHFAQPKDTPLRLLALIQVPTLLYGLKRGSNKIPLQHAYLSLDMPLYLQPDLLSIHHQPSTSTPYKTYY
jgi:hypothetical protein